MTWWQTALISLAGVVGSIIVAWRTGQSSDRATDKSTAAAGRKDETDRLVLFTNQLSDRLKTVEAALEAAQSRITSLEQDLSEQRSRFGTLVDYAHTLRRIMSLHSIEVPEPPMSLREHL